ncbi:hypothetical protein Cni_G25376 [Canna indica]|uniref:Homeobox domain-containing protein n=1 Tax=Canna indica TaxID=4628 RepID=A0AAQ3QMD2_9LILI|nr:hypothetical protein Cni_G25376 [Canna indica]
MTQTPSTRWCPTPEQLMILEDMYGSGVRNPNATQIQQITAHLSLYGKIECKNVFYWFQNHKARDRQKLTRRLMSSLHHQAPSSAEPSPTRHSSTITKMRELDYDIDEVLELKRGSICIRLDIDGGTGVVHSVDAGAQCDDHDEHDEFRRTLQQLHRVAGG